MPGPPEMPTLSGKEYLRLVVLGAVIGIPAALVAAGFLALVHEVEDWLWHDLPSHLGATGQSWYLVLTLPVAGALIVLAARTWLPGDGGHLPLNGISVDPTPVSHAPGIAVAAIGTLAFGAVLGPEAPLIALGSTVGLAITALTRIRGKETGVLATAGSFSAISALFGGPLVAGILILEAGVGLGATLIPILLPGLVAAAVGYVVFLGIGNWGGIETFEIVVPGLPPYEGTHVLDLVLAVVVGVVAALVITVVRRLASEVAGTATLRLGSPLVLVGGGLAVGVLALLADALGAEPDDILFSGQTAIPGLVSDDSVKVLIVILVAKAIAYAVCLGCGFRGGPVFPAIFLGIDMMMLAAAIFDVSPTLAVAVGTAAGMAAMTRLLFASVLFASLLVGTAGADAISAAVLAAVAAWLAMAALDRRQPAPTR